MNVWYFPQIPQTNKMKINLSLFWIALILSSENLPYQRHVSRPDLETPSGDSGHCTHIMFSNLIRLGSYGPKLSPLGSLCC